MIARIVPHARTVRTLSVFDYEIPTDMHVVVGDVVIVPFRTSKILGVVWEITQYSESKKLRSILTVLPYSAWRLQSRRKFLEWFAQWHAISLPHAFKTLQHTFPKKIRPYADISHNDTQLTFERLQSYTPHIIQAQRYPTLLQWYARALKIATTHTLIICPAHRDAQIIAQSAPKYNTIVISENTTPKKITEIEWELHNSQTPYIVIGTKKLLSLNPLLFGTIVLDQEESNGHKQRELNPRFHTRTALIHSVTQAELVQEYFPRVVFTSIAPSIELFYLYTIQKVTRELLPEIDKRESAIRVISMDEEKQKGNYSWFSEDVIERVLHSKKALLFLNRTGEYSYYMCTLCSAVLTHTAASCTMCGSSALRIVRKGIAQLEEECNKLFSHTIIRRIDRTTAETEIQKYLKEAGIILATEKIFHVTTLDIFDYIAILSVDHLLSYPQYRAHERTYQLLRHFFSSSLRCDVQSHAPQHLVITSATENNYDKFATQELEMRKIVHAPPYGYRARIINTHTHEMRLISTPPTQPLPQHEMLDPEY